MKKPTWAHETPPDALQHVQAERTLLGTAFNAALNGDVVCFSKVSETLCVTDFYASKHRLLWQVLLTLMARDQCVSFLTLTEQVETQAADTSQALVCYALESIHHACLVHHIPSYVACVKEYALRRHLQSLSAYLQRQAQDRRQPIHAVLQQASEQLLTLVPDTHANLQHAESLIDAFAQTLQQRYAGTLSPLGLQTGLSELDRRTLGLHPGQLIVLAARPGMGKTTLAMNWILSALNQQQPVLFASLEMSHAQLTERLVSMAANVTGEQIKDPGGCCRLAGQALTALEWEQLTQAMQQLKTAPLHILDQGYITVSHLRVQAKKLAHQYAEQGGLGLVVVDYLQLLETDHTRTYDNRNQEISRHTRALKLLARELNCPLVCVSQLSRECEKRTDKRPLASDLRDSGSIEQDADVIVLIYRDEIYHPHGAHQGTAEILLAKVREGEPGSFHVKADLARYQFSDLDVARVRRLQSSAKRTSFAV